MLKRRKPDIPERRREMVALADGCVVEAYVGYRFWRFNATFGHVFLTSVWHHGFLWQPRTPVKAACDCKTYFGFLTAGNQARAHRCGVYAFSDPEAQLDNLPSAQSYLQGEVYLWGKVVHHERGYRASHGQIASLFTWPGMDEVDKILTEMTAEQYGVPLVRDRIRIIADQPERR